MEMVRLVCRESRRERPCYRLGKLCPREARMKRLLLLMDTRVRRLLLLNDVKHDYVEANRHRIADETTTNGLDTRLGGAE